MENTNEKELNLTDAEKALSNKAKNIAREKELIKLKNKSEKTLILSTIFAVGLIVVAIIIGEGADNLAMKFVHIAEIVLLLSDLMVFVSAGFNYLDSTDELKAIEKRRNRGMRS